MEKIPNERTDKITAEHVDRAAYIYVRQSSHYQVEHHLQSQRRQYDLAKQAAELGWHADKIVVVDEDQGKSGASAHTRAGFGRLVSAVGRSEVGIVMSLEASRLARNSPDWHNLIYMCRYTNTLLADEHGIYDPSSGTDRMILGIRGQMSEMELDTSIHRMVQGRLNKARRGEYLIDPPAGYDLDDSEQLVISSDEAVANALRLVFRKFDEIQSARGVFNWWRSEGLKFPVRQRQLRSKPVQWVEPAYRHFMTVLHHPTFSGAYAFGGTESVRELDSNDPRKVVVSRKKRETWKVLLKDHHPAYISWEKFEQNQARLKANVQYKANDDFVGARGPARQGEAWLQGLVRCGRCGRGMTVTYGGRRSSPTTKRTMQYRCGAVRRIYEGRECQVVGSQRINDTVMNTFLEVTKTAGVEAGAMAQHLLDEENDQTERAWTAQIEKATYEAQRAERQFHAVEPENRTVARTLETRWNACLQELETLRTKVHKAREHRRPLTELETARARRLGADLQRVWDAGSTTQQDRKQLLRAAISEVQIRPEEHDYAIKILWKGGATTDKRVKRIRRGDKGMGHATPEDTLELVRTLAVEFDDRQIAVILNKQKRVTGDGNPFTGQRVAMLRNRNAIAVCPKRAPRDPREGPFTADETAAQLGVTSSTIHRWLKQGVLPGRQATPGAPWSIVLTEELRRRLCNGDAPPGWLGLSEAAKRLGRSKQLVAYQVKHKKLKAIRVSIGGRSYWKIDVSSADSVHQTALFDQTMNAVFQEA